MWLWPTKAYGVERFEVRVNVAEDGVTQAGLPFLRGRAGRDPCPAGPQSLRYARGEAGAKDEQRHGGPLKRRASARARTATATRRQRWRQSLRGGKPRRSPTAPLARAWAPAPQAGRGDP